MIKPSFLVTRRKFFHNQLLDLVKKYHNVNIFGDEIECFTFRLCKFVELHICLQEFLAAQTVPIIVDSNKLIRWHPQFRIDEVPDIVPSELPLPEDSQKVTTAKEVLDKIKGLYSTKVILMIFVNRIHCIF